MYSDSFVCWPSQQIQFQIKLRLSFFTKHLFILSPKLTKYTQKMSSSCFHRINQTTADQPVIKIDLHFHLLFRGTSLIFVGSKTLRKKIYNWDLLLLKVFFLPEATFFINQSKTFFHSLEKKQTLKIMRNFFRLLYVL